MVSDLGQPTPTSAVRRTHHPSSDPSFHQGTLLCDVEQHPLIPPRTLTVRSWCDEIWLACKRCVSGNLSGSATTSGVDPFVAHFVTGIQSPFSGPPRPAKAQTHPMTGARLFQAEGGARFEWVPPVSRQDVVSPPPLPRARAPTFGRESHKIITLRPLAPGKHSNPNGTDPTSTPKQIWNNL